MFAVILQLTSRWEIIWQLENGIYIFLPPLLLSLHTFQIKTLGQSREKGFVYGLLLPTFSLVLLFLFLFFQLLCPRYPEASFIMSSAYIGKFETSLLIFQHLKCRSVQMTLWCLVSNVLYFVWSNDIMKKKVCDSFTLPVCWIEKSKHVHSFVQIKEP